MPLSSSSGVQASVAPWPGNRGFRISPPSQLQVFSACRLTHLMSCQLGRRVAGLRDGIVQVHFEGREGIAGKDKSRLRASVRAAWQPRHSYREGCRQVGIKHEHRGLVQCSHSAALLRYTAAGVPLRGPTANMSSRTNSAGPDQALPGAKEESPLGKDPRN